MVNITEGVLKVINVTMCDEDVKLEDTCLLCNKALINGAPCTEHGNNVKQYECLFCDLSFSRQASLVWHLRTSHKYKLNINPNRSPSLSEHNYYERPTCTRCKVVLRNAYELEKHLCGGSEHEITKLEQSSEGNEVVESSETQSSKVNKPVESPVIKPSKVKKPVESPVIKPSKVKKPVESAVTQPNKRKEPVESSAIQNNKAKKAVESSETKPNKGNKSVESPVTHCTTCSKDFSSENLYRKHLSKYVTKYRPFFCCICQTTFSRKRSLIFHLYIHKRSSEPESKVSRLSDIPVPPRAYPYVPAQKMKKAPTKQEVKTEEAVRKSARVSTETSKQKSKKPVPKDRPQIIDVRNNAASNQKCTMCQKKFKKVLDLETHMISFHHAPLMHKCSLCPEAFVLKASLLNHAISHIF